MKRNNKKAIFSVITVIVISMIIRKISKREKFSCFYI